MTTTSSPPPATPSRTRRVIAITLAIIAALVVAFFVFASLYADWLWFDQLGFTEVLLTQWIARVVMFVVGFLGMAVPVWLSIQLAYRLRPVYARLSSQLDRYQEVVEPLRRLAMWGIPVFFGFFAGFAASAQWETTWLWFNGVATDTTDPEFHLDTGFYMFAMPFWSALIGFASAVLLICLLVTALVSYLYGSVRIGQRELRISKSARIQLAVIAGLYLLVQAASLWLDRYKTLVESGADDRITGPGYTGVNAIIPGQTILAIVAVIVAILFFVTAIIGRWRYPLIATALLVVSAIVVGVGYPWVVNTFQVQPNRFSLEEEYYQRNVDMTHQAYGVDGLEQEDFTAVTDVEAGQLREDAATTAQVRIMDPAIISPNVRQLEQYRSYYQFADPLDVDRYERRRGLAGHGGLGARAEPRAARQRGGLAELRGRLHARLRHRRGQGQRPHRRGGSRVPRARHPCDRLPVRPRGLPAARLLRRVLAAVLDRRRARERRPGRARLPVGRGRARARPRPRSTATAGRASAASSTGSSTR